MMENSFHPDAYIFREGKINLHFILSVCFYVYLYLTKAELNQVGPNHMSSGKNTWMEGNIYKLKTLLEKMRTKQQICNFPSLS